MRAFRTDRPRSVVSANARVRPSRRFSWRSSRVRLIFRVLALAGLISAMMIAWPRREPPDVIVIDGGRKVKDFALVDVNGEHHDSSEWKGRIAVVLFFLATECPVSNAYAPELARLAKEYGPRGFAFYGIHADPDVSAEKARTHADEYRLSFPILLDLDQSVASQAGVKVTPEAVVMVPDGQVVYRGRIDDRHTSDGRVRTAGIRSELVEALDSLTARVLPVTSRAEAYGCPLPTIDYAEVAASRPTFHKDVAPILWKNCASCHRPGQVGPFPLLSYRDAAKRASFLKDVTSSRRMPPWKPQPGHGIFHDDPRLSAKEIATIASWSVSGAPEGDPSDAHEPPKFTEGWHLGDPDLILTMPEPFTVPADGGDIYRAFVLPMSQDRDRTVEAVEFRPGNRRVVHHVRIFTEGDEAIRKKDREDQGPGFRSPSGGNDLNRPGLAEWLPGTTPRVWPEGIGKVVRAGTDLVIVTHYHAVGKAEVDRSSIGLYFRDSPSARRVAGIPLSTAKIDIPAGEKRHKISLQAVMPADARAYGVIPHGHYLLREMKLTATLPDGRVQPMLWITDWDFDWQGQYQYVAPVRLPKGTILRLTAYYDNSAENPRNPNSPPIRVRYGAGSKDEMLGCHLQVIADGEADERAIRAKWPLGL